MYYYDTSKKLFHIALKSDKLPEWRSFCGEELIVWKKGLMTEKIPDDGALCTKCLQMIGSSDKTIEDEVRQKIQKKPIICMIRHRLPTMRSLCFKNCLSALKVMQKR